MVRLVRPDRPGARNYSSRREQLRLLLLLVPLGLVIIAIGRLRDPTFANRVNQLFAQSAVEPQTAAPRENSDQPASGQNTSAPAATPGRPLPVGAFRSGSETAKEADPPPKKEHDKLGAAETPPAAEGLFPGVQLDQLATIKDNSYFRNAEKAAWLQWFALLQNVSAESFASARPIEANYVQLVDQPYFYRGKLVNVYGIVRQVTGQTPAPNDLGIASYFRVVLQPADGSSWPIFVYCLKLPPELKVGDDQPGGSAKVTGLFFKKLSYAWQDGLGTAPVIVANSIEYHGVAPCGPARADVHPPIAAESWSDRASENNSAQPGDALSDEPMTPFRDVLDIAGWSAGRLAEFDDNQPLSDAQRIKALELLRRLRTFGTADLDRWARRDLRPRDVAQNPAAGRGELVPLAGRVTKVTPREPSPADALRLEMPRYFECEVSLSEAGGTATILTARAPREWLKANVLDEPFTAVSLYVKSLENDDRRSTLWLAKEVAWHPGQLSDDGQDGATIDRTLGKSVLGNLGMDVGLLDHVQARGSIRAEETDAFYKMLDAVGSIGANQLARFAKQNLPVAANDWKQRHAAATDSAQRLLTQEVLHLANEGRYSVVPLFRDAQAQIGRLFVFDGTARRVVRVEVAAQTDDGSSQSAHRFGFDHYYEMEVFTDDSQNNPLVFCVRELPDGFPVGDSLHVPVSMAGFFFKDWVYRTRGVNVPEKNDDTNDTTGVRDPVRYAPLLIGRAPLLLTFDESKSLASQYVGIGIFLLGLAGIWAAAAIYSRGDRRFRRQTQAANFSLPPGQSLDSLHVAAAETSANSAVQIGPATSEGS